MSTPATPAPSAADNNAPTPRTDANSFEAYQWDGSGYGEGIFNSVGKAVHADVARTIERELAASEAANRKASEDALLMRDGLLKQLAAKDAEIARRKAQLDMWTSAAMDGNAAIAQLTARAEKAEAELAQTQQVAAERAKERLEWNAENRRERDALRADVESKDAEIAELIKERDEAEDAADEIASEVLGEAIDWPDHDAAWRRAAEAAKEMRFELHMRRNSPAMDEVIKLRAALAAAQATAREAMDEADHYKRIFKSNGASMELMASRIPTGGQVIDAVIRAAAVTADSPGVLVWSANAAEQIEAALAKIAEEGQAQP